MYLVFRFNRAKIQKVNQSVLERDQMDEIQIK